LVSAAAHDKRHDVTVQTLIDLGFSAPTGYENIRDGFDVGGLARCDLAETRQADELGFVRRQEGFDLIGHWCSEVGR
jgi:hypothetical protein